MRGAYDGELLQKMDQTELLKLTATSGITPQACLHVGLGDRRQNLTVSMGPEPSLA